MTKIPRSILEKLNFDNNTELFKSIKKLCKTFYCTDKEIYKALKEYDLYDIEKQYFNPKRNYSEPQLSIENEKFEHLLHDNNIKYEVEFNLGNYFYDFKIGNILIEINPSWTHNSSYNVTISRRKVNKLSETYHYDKTKFAIDKGYIVINVYEWNNVINLLPILKGEFKVKMYFRGIQKHNIKLISSSKYRSFVLSEDNKILKEANCYIFDDGYDLIAC